MSLRTPLRPFRWLAAVALAGALGACTGPGSPAMTQQRMEAIIAGAGSDFGGSPGAVEFRIDGVPMACVSDLTHDRMRLIAPIVEESRLTPQQRSLMLIANFHTALDARYATSRGVVYAAFLHPLSPLTEEELLSALRQVAALARNFGTSYSSGELLYGAPAGEPL